MLVAPPLPAPSGHKQAFGGSYQSVYDSTVYLAAPMDHDFRAALAYSSQNPVPVAVR